MVPKHLRYSKTHEWASVEGGICTVGITAFAAEQLTDIVTIDYKVKVGQRVIGGEEGKEFGEIEAVKTVAGVYVPVSGEVMELNQAVAGDPSLVSSDPYGKGWMVRIKMDPGQKLDHLLTAEQYDQQIASQGH